MKKFLILIVMMLTVYAGFGQGLKTSGTDIVDQNDVPVILRGMGLGGWMLMEGYMMQSSDVADTQWKFKERLVDLMGEAKTDEFFDAWLDNHATKADVDSLASWGFNSIRLPMHYNLFTPPIEDEPVPGEITWLTKGFDMVDSLLHWCEVNNIYLILDLHAAPGGQGANAAISDYDPSKPSLWESQDNKDKTVALWRKLAERYNDEPWIGGYDLLNEVNWTLPGNVELKALYVEITNAIREVDNNHIIFIEGNSFANDFTGLTPPWDDNMAYSFHKYWSYNDQGSIQWVLDIREQHNVPLWMGEAGENSNVWFHDAIQLFEDNGIGWSWWPMKRIETIVSPFSILFTQGYKDVLSYWRGQGPQPSVDEAYASMMELAINTNSMNCPYRKDVHDAQIRQTTTNEIIPFANHVIPGVVHMADFDLGPLNYAYYDVDNANYSLSTGEFQAWNSGWVYRNDGVDIETNNDSVNSNGFHIGFIHKDEWTKYTVQIFESAAYTIKARVASQENGGKFHLALDGEDITETQTVSSTGGWTDFVDLEITDVLLSQEEHVLTLWFDDEAAINISSLEFIQTGTGEQVPFNALNGSTREDEKSIEVALNHSISPESIEASLDHFSVLVNGEERPVSEVTMDITRDRTITLIMEDAKVYSDEILLSYSGNMITSVSGKTLETFEDLPIRNTLSHRAILPQKIQAEDFNDMVGLGLEETTDLGGGYNLGWTDPGDYADYLVFNANEGFFQIDMRVAAQSGSGEIGFSLIDENLVETELLIKEIPSTGGWQTWTTLSENSAVPGGNYTLRMRVIAGGFNLNWFEFHLLDGVDDAQSKSILNPRVYPTPVKNNQVFIDYGNIEKEVVKIDMYNISGSLISSNVYPLIGSIATINISDLPKGVYIFKSYIGNYTVSSRVIKL